MMCKVLIFGCIAAVILMTAAYGTPLTTAPPCTPKKELLEASMDDLTHLKNSTPLCLYTPNDMPECTRTTLECYLKELKVLKEDFEEEDQRHVINIIKNLEEFKAGYSSDPTCKTCEYYDKKPFPAFRQELLRFLQRMWKGTNCN